jgi:hypothetical protein
MNGWIQRSKNFQKTGHVMAWTVHICDFAKAQSTKRFFTHRPKHLWVETIPTLIACAFGFVCLMPNASGEPADKAKSTVSLYYFLDQFGRTDTPVAAQSAYEAATQSIRAAGGGILAIPANVPHEWRPANITQEEWREPAPPAPAKRWGEGPGTTIVDLRSGAAPAQQSQNTAWLNGEVPAQTPTLRPPQISGMIFSRTLQLPLGQSLPHWNCNPLLSMENTIARGSTGYREWLQEDVKTGKGGRFYVPTIRGVFPGMFLNTDDHAGTQRLYVQSLGYDSKKKRWYFIADTDADVKKGTLIHNKNHVNIVRMDTYSHNENQTFDLMLWRRNYSQGDNYLIDARFKYMSDVHSGTSDENGVIFAALVESITNIFRGTVETWSPETSELLFRDPQNHHTLGSGRPIINLNPEKWITGGTAFIKHPGGARLGWPGTIRTNDAPWTDEVVGRYFAIDEPDEYVPNSNKVRRWWLITAFSEHDGIKMLTIQRHWWGAKNKHSVGSLYNRNNYTLYENKPKPLKYIIAPGINAHDVADGLPAAGERRTIRLSPAPFGGTAVDFASGDPIEQAIGPDPFLPMPFRSWMWDKVPGIFSSAVFDIANHGDVRRHSVLSIRGGSGNLSEDRETRYDKKTPWSQLIGIDGSSNEGITFSADVQKSAILFTQPRIAQKNPHVIQWNGDRKLIRNLGVDEFGIFRQQGNAPIALSQTPMTQVGGLSTTQTKAANLSGCGVAVPAGKTVFHFALPVAEPDRAYVVTVRPSWITNYAVTKQTKDGVEVEFDRPAPKDAKLDWLLIR